MLKVYVAGPLTKRGKSSLNASPAGRQLNVTEAMAVACELVERGYNVYVPHYSHYIDLLASQPIPYETWMAIDFEWLERCDVLYRMPGHSPGAEREVEHAKQRGIPVVFLLSELDRERARQEAFAEFCQLMPHQKGNKELFEAWRAGMRCRVQQVVAGATPRVDPERLAVLQAGALLSQADDPQNELVRPGITPKDFNRPSIGPEPAERRADWQARIAGSAQVLLDTRQAEAKALAEAEAAKNRAYQASLAAQQEALDMLKRRKLGEAQAADQQVSTFRLDSLPEDEEDGDDRLGQIEDCLDALQPDPDDQIVIEVRRRDGSSVKRLLA